MADLEELVELIRDVLSYHGVPVETITAIDGQRIVIDFEGVDSA